MAMNPGAWDPARRNSNGSQSLSEKSGQEVPKLKENYDLENQGAERRNSRIAPIHSNTSDDRLSVTRQVELEAENAIKYRTCSWQKTAALLFSEYICLAIMSFPWSYSILGLVPGLILTVVVAGLVLYTSLIVWRFCLRHPEVRDVCDIGQYLFWDSRIAWWVTAIMFLLNNTFIQGLHCLVGAKYLNTMTGGGTCTIVWSLVAAIISWVFSLPRTFNTLSKAATFSAFFTFISVLLATIFAAIEARPAGDDPDSPTPGGWLGNPVVTAVPVAGTTFVSGLNAFLNISYTFIGQITLPSFIAEMKEPKDFWKSVTAVTVAEVIVFSVVGAVVYVYTGNQYMTSPAFGSLGDEVYKKVSFSFMIPTLIFLGVLYASVSARFIFFRIFEGTRHKSNHTVVGWASWAGILAALWIAAWIIAEVIPFFSDLLSIMSSLFDSFFGFIFWGVAYLRMRHADYGPGFYKKRGIRGWIGFIVNVLIILCGLFFLGPGTYASVDSVVLSYEAGNVGSAFSCANNGL
ncbi:neutral amino acid permease, putative [Paecilomyces variotii No. 5]|uniref:Neutral amino acid permease, putative n=1 Tax=Byssochlamys spectabilis (strain No. 5 / NBRC 109023) TaxID=1356009 RepID=V5G9J1_BYSSN|nr:neutral amino acid permease, putative [Paecilomyces variotii No. 5]